MSEHTEQSVRAEVRQWLDSNWDVSLSLLEWRNKLIDSGWGAPHWPKEWYGRDLPVGLVPVVEEEIERAGAVGILMMGIRPLAAATILAHGTDLHKEKFLRRILTGEDTWCQLFSEPGSGSDLAGAITRAELPSGNRTWARVRSALATTSWMIPSTSAAVASPELAVHCAISTASVIILEFPPSALGLKKLLILL